MNWAIYIHIPFCASRCAYCDFCTTTGSDSDLVDRYTEAVRTEIKLHNLPVTDTVTSVYFGGGTPSFIDENKITTILRSVREKYRLSDDAEITIEANPESLTPSKLNTYRKSGINRISIGIQTFNDRFLDLLGRIHSSDEARNAVDSARSAGFENISIDLIFGIPGQTESQLDMDLAEAIALNPEHISIYNLTREPGTPFDRECASGKIIMPDEDLCARMFMQCSKTMTENGYEHYELSNYARDGLSSRHNSHHWSRQPYKGFGLSAHSCSNGKRSWNHSGFEKYFQKLDRDILPTAGEEQLTNVQQLNEALMLGLRTANGISLSELSEEFGKQTIEIVRNTAEVLTADPETISYFRTTQNTLALTPEGMFLSDEIIAKFLLDPEQFPGI